MKIDIDEALPEGFEFARFAKPMTREAELAPNERKLIVDVILRPKQPRRWEIEACSETVPLSFNMPTHGKGNLQESERVRIVREILPETANEEWQPQNIAPTAKLDDWQKPCGVEFDATTRTAVKFTPIRFALPGIGDWIQILRGGFVRATDGYQAPRTIYRRDETKE